MSIEVVTKQDLNEFRIQLLNDIHRLIEHTKVKPIRPWLKHSEVRKLLNVSSNTVQRLRIDGKLRSSKIGGIHFYRFEDIEKMMNNEVA